MLTLRRVLARLRRDRRGATAVVVAVTLPAMIIAMAAAIETALIDVRTSQLQSVADAAAGAARQVYNPYQSGAQPASVDEAVRIATANGDADEVNPNDVEIGWWDITKTGDARWTAFFTGQTGLPFYNAVRVTARLNYQVGLAQLLGVNTIPLAKQGTAYKCSNTDYPLTRVEDDAPPPSLPAVWMSWATPGHPDPNTSYYYLQPDGAHNPVIKFYSPYDGEDVSFVLFVNGAAILQADTYCAGTYLVSPALFDTRAQSGQWWRNPDGSPAVVTASVLRGSTNNSLDVFPPAQQGDYPFAFQPTPYYTANEVLTPQMDANAKTTPYPSAYGIQYWASEGNPTPDRRALLVQ